MNKFWLLGLLAVFAAGRSSANAPCNHPYYPATAGATWQYKITGAFNQQYTQKILSNSGSSFVVQSSFNNVSTRNTIRCNADGSLSQTQYGDVSGANLSSQIQTVSSSGVSLSQLAGRNHAL